MPIFLHLDCKTFVHSFTNASCIIMFYVIPEPYTIRAARIHLSRVLDLLRAPGPQDALREGRSPSVLETITHTQATGTHTLNAPPNPHKLEPQYNRGLQHKRKKTLNVC